MYLLVPPGRASRSFRPSTESLKTATRRENAKEMRARIQVQSIYFLIQHASHGCGHYSVPTSTIRDNPLPSSDSRPGARLLESIRIGAGGEPTLRTIPIGLGHERFRGGDDEGAFNEPGRHQTSHPQHPTPLFSPAPSSPD